MGVDVVVSKLAHVSVEIEGEENGKINQVTGIDEPIKFGSLGVDEPVKREANKVFEVDFLKKENGKINQVVWIDEPIKFGSLGVDELVKGEANKVFEVDFPKKENGKINQVTGIDEPIIFGSLGVDEPVKGEANKDSVVDFPKKENGKINQVTGIDKLIKFGSLGVDEPVKGETNKVSKAEFPKEAVDEWPTPKQIHSFFFVKCRSFEDQKLKAKLEQVYKEVQRKNQQCYQLIEKLRAKKSERAQVISHLKAHGVEKKQYRMRMDEKRGEMEPLQRALRQLCGASFIARDRRSSLCSSEEELNDVIKSLQYRIQHETIPLNEEKQILREIKQFEGTREKVNANATMRAKIQESMGEKEALQDQVKLIGVDLDRVRKEQQVLKAKVKQLEEEKEAIEKEIKSLEEELTTLTQKRNLMFENIHQLRKQREERNSPFYENRLLLTKAKDFAAKKDIDALKDLSETEVNKFISCWSSSKAFREDYERRILSSLDMRQLSKDAWMRNPDEKPLLVVESTTSIGYKYLL